MDYKAFLEKKQIKDIPSGFEPTLEINPMLFDFQIDITRWAIRRGRAAIFADCGLGKTPIQLEWARHIVDKTGGDILIFAPLAVSRQTRREGDKFGVKVNICREQSDIKPGINITNYEMFHKFEPDKFAGVILDESSILKSHTGKFRTALIQAFDKTQYKLACTATPAPNDHMELGNHSEFLNIFTRAEMLSTFFVHDGGDTSKWRLKGHAQDDFWKWLCSWAVMIRKPSDLGYKDNDFNLPEIEFIQHIVKSPPLDGYLFAMKAQTLGERRQAKRESISDRVSLVADLVKDNEPWLIWCNLNDESAALSKAIPDSTEVKGADSSEHKEKSMLGFSSGEIRAMVTKPSIAGFGMNWQHCSNMAFVGLSDSYEQFYQAIRRCWRFGQKKNVKVHIVTAEAEGAIVENIKRKESDAMTMADEMVKNMSDISYVEIRDDVTERAEYKTANDNDVDWNMYLGDCVEEVKNIQNETIGLSIFSPPFASLYTYSSSERDMGNTRNDEDFFNHFEYLIPELFRITMPGRNCCVHCMDLPMTKSRDGFIGLRDFKGDIIRLFQKHGWIYHSTVCIWKDPVTAMQRTKALGLLHKQIKKDSCRSRQGIPDYVVTFRKDGENPEPVSHTNESFPVSQWQEWASPIWMDIKPSKTLQRMSAREEKDERHICPLQLEVIERCIMLWSNENDIIFSPFAGIGSEGYVAIQKNRRFVGIELKESYYKQAVKNLKVAMSTRQSSLFDLMGENE